MYIYTIIYMYITKVLHCWCHSAFHISRNFFPSKRDGHTEGHSPLQPRSAASASCRASPWENVHHEKWWKKWGQTMKYPLNMGGIHTIRSGLGYVLDIWWLLMAIWWILTDIHGYLINGHFRILEWRYVSTIFQAIFSGDILLHRPEK